MTNSSSISEHPKDPDTAFRELASTIIRSCGKDRKHFAAELAPHLGQRITAYMLDSWTARAKKSARFPAVLVAPFCEIAGDDQLQRMILGPRLSALLELGEAVAEVVEEQTWKQFIAVHRRALRREKKGVRRG